MRVSVPFSRPLSRLSLTPLLLLALFGPHVPLTAPSPLAAQDPPARDAHDRDVANALARVPPGSAVRIQTRAGEVLGGFMRLAGDSVVLEGTDPLGVPLADVRSVWYQRRTTRTGAITGALVGAAAGGAFMGLLAVVSSASGNETVTLLAVGTLGGGAAGGLLGGVVGAAIPHWVLVFPSGAEDRAGVPEVTVRTDARVGRRRLGSFEASLGYGRIAGAEPTGGGPGGRVALHAELGADPARARGTTTFFAVGPELSWFDLGSTDRVRRAVFPSGDTLEFSREYRALTAGGVVRGGLATGLVRTYAVLGLAYNRWEIDQRDEEWINPSGPPPDVVIGESRFEHLGYTIGAGTQATLRPLTAVGLELRRTSVGTFDMDLPGSYWSVTLAASRRW